MTRFVESGWTITVALVVVCGALIARSQGWWSP
jgi:ABC-type xylose transport system permease subunit